MDKKKGSPKMSISLLNNPNRTYSEVENELKSAITQFLLRWFCPTVTLFHINQIGLKLYHDIIQTYDEPDEEDGT